MELLAIIGSCAALGVPLLKGIHHQKQRVASGASQLDQMTESQFEEYLETMMWKLGYQVERPRYTDLLHPLSNGKTGKPEKISPTFIISTHQLTISVYTQYDGELVNIQSAITAQKRYGCGSAMIVCSGNVSESMLSLARREKVIVWTRTDVIKAARSARCQSLTPWQSVQEAGSRYSEEYISNPQPLLA